MSHLFLHRHVDVALRVHVRTLRLRVAEVQERVALLRHQAEHLLAARRDGARDAEADDPEALGWYRAEVRRMLAAGWSRAELADVGVSDALLRELGLHGSAAS
jgi:uncharacterized small protein (DUF1192 family)